MRRSSSLTVAVSLFTLAATLALPSLAAPPARERCPYPGGLTELLAELPAESVDEAEARWLAHMREEEKVARDVYTALDDVWGLRIFSNIARAEQQHFESVLVVLDKYDLADPAAGLAPGVFADPALQSLHDTLLARGSQSLVLALSVGALIEETDIADLQRAIAETVNEDIATLYQNLLKGSRNHLRAFDELLAANGVDYAATMLTQAEYDAIADSAKEQGLVDAHGEPVPGCGPAGQGRGSRQGGRRPGRGLR